MRAVWAARCATAQPSTRPRQRRHRWRAAAARVQAPPAPPITGLEEQAVSSSSSSSSPGGTDQTAAQPAVDVVMPAAADRATTSAQPAAAPSSSVPASSSGSSSQGLWGNMQLLLQAAETTAARLRRQLEPPPPGFPPGPAGDVAVQMLGGQPLAFFETLRREHGTVVGLLLGGERVVLVSDPAAARAVLVEPGQEVFVKTGTAFFPGSSLAGNGLLVSDGEVWRRQRRLANPAFRRTAVERYAQAMLSATQAQLLGRWRDGGARDLYADFNALTLRITLEALFGAELAGGDARAAREVTAAIQDAFRYFAARGASALVIPEFVPTPDNLLFGAAVARLDRAVYGLIAARRRELAQAPRPPRDLLDSLLLAADESGEGMGDTALRDELLTLLVAGQETSAILLGWACAYLAHHPAAQEAAAAEVQALLASGRELEAGDARRLPYIEAVLLEAMRLSPPAYLMGRCAAEDTTLAGYFLPKGTTVLVCPHLMHRDPQWWGPDAASFRPERWLELAAQQETSSSGGGGGGMAFLSNMGPHSAYVPFGAGARNCIGTGFAMMEGVLVLAAALRRWRLAPLPGAPFPAPQPQITLRPDAVRLLLRRRR